MIARDFEQFDLLFFGKLMHVAARPAGQGIGVSCDFQPFGMQVELDFVTALQDRLDNGCDG